MRRLSNLSDRIHPLSNYPSLHEVAAGVLPVPSVEIVACYKFVDAVHILDFSFKFISKANNGRE